MLAWVGFLFALVIFAACLVDALFGATAKALAEDPAPIETLDGALRAFEAANDEPTTAWSMEEESLEEESGGVSSVRPRVATVVSASRSGLAA
jgi:hypothetical protein